MSILLLMDGDVMNKSTILPEKLRGLQSLLRLIKRKSLNLRKSKPENRSSQSHGKSATLAIVILQKTYERRGYELDFKVSKNSLHLQKIQI